MNSDPRLDDPAELDTATQHSAQHLLSATILTLTGKPTVSMHIGSDFSTIDVDAPDLSAKELAEAEAAVYDAVEADCPIIAHLCPPENLDDFPLRKKPPQDEEVIRVLEIRGHDFTPCSGLHLPSTGRIGMLKVIGAEKYKGMVRVSFVAGRRAYRDYAAVRAAAEKASLTLRVPPAETGDAAAALSERLAQQERALVNAREALAALEAAKLIAAAGGKAIVECYGDRSMDEALRVGRAAQKHTAATIIVAAAADRKAAALTSDKTADLRPAMKVLMDAQEGKGGGGPSFVQAAFPSKAQLDAFLAAARAQFAPGDK